MSSGAAEKVVIVGGGIIGIACAHFLVREGYQVTVLDKGEIGAGCSFRNCGHILPSHVLPLNSVAALKQGVLSVLNPKAPFKIQPTLAPSVLNWFTQFARNCGRKTVEANAFALMDLLSSSFQEFQALPQELRAKSQWRQSGLLYAFKSQRALEGFANVDRELSDRFGVSAEHLSGDQVTASDASMAAGLAGGFLYPGDAQVSPEALINNWVPYLESLGVKFEPFTTVTGADYRSGMIATLRTDERVIAADHVVLAAGVHCAELANLFESVLPIQPGKGYSVTLRNLSQTPKHALLLPECHIAITAFEKSLRIGSMMEFVGYNVEIPQFRVDQLTTNVAPYFSAPIVAEVDQPWFGWRPMTWDGLPIIGRLKRAANVIVATGHSMIGLMTAPGTGKLVSDLISERKPHLDALPFSPHRFNA